MNVHFKKCEFNYKKKEDLKIKRNLHLVVGSLNVESLNFINESHLTIYRKKFG